MNRFEKLLVAAFVAFAGYTIGSIIHAWIWGPAVENACPGNQCQQW